MPGDIRCNSKKYRVMRNGNGEYIVQERGMLWGWNTKTHGVAYRVSIPIHYFSLTQACDAVRKYEKQDREHELAKQWTEVRCD